MVTMDPNTMVLDTNCINNDCDERVKMLTLTDSKTGVIGLGLGVTGKLSYLTKRGIELLGISQLELNNTEGYINLEDYVFQNDERKYFKQLMSTLQESGDNSTLIKLRSSQFVWADIVDAPTLLTETIYNTEDVWNSRRMKPITEEIADEAMNNLLNDKRFKAIDTASSSMVIHRCEVDSFMMVRRIDTGLGLSDDDDDEMDMDDDELLANEKNRKAYNSFSSNADAYDEEGVVEFEGMSMYRDKNIEETENNCSRPRGSCSDAQSSTSHTTDTTTTDSANSSESNNSNINYRTTPMNRLEYAHSKDNGSSRSGTADTEYWSGSSDSNSNKSSSDRNGLALEHTDTEEEMNFEDVFEEYEKEDPVNDVSDSLKHVGISRTFSPDVPTGCEDGKLHSPKLQARDFSRRNPPTNRQTEPFLSATTDELDADDGDWFLGSI